MHVVAAGGRSCRMIFTCLGMVACGGSVSRGEGPEASGEAAASGTSGEAGTSSSGGDGGLSCEIQASDYDQSCMVDSDCVFTAGSFPVTFGDYCEALCLCPSGAINQRAAAQYVRDVSRTPFGSGALGHVGCNCGLVTGPCCLAGQCSVDCFGVPPCTAAPCSTDMTDSGIVDARSSASIPDGSVLCSSQLGLVDSAVANGGALYRCGPSQTCTPLNGGWGCCMSVGPEQVFCEQVEASTSP
jgi:hypothetical protein